MRIFVSSTWKDLQGYRAEVIAALREAGWAVPDTYEASPNPTIEALEADIKSCDCFVGLTGHFYGSRIARGDRSYTEFEYDVCSGPNSPHALMFLADEDFP